MNPSVLSQIRSSEEVVVMVTRTHGVVIARGNQLLGLDSDLSLKIMSLQNG
jgi:hypothetical protein